jgi:hypothetical protein
VADRAASESRKLISVYTGPQYPCPQGVMNVLSTAGDLVDRGSEAPDFSPGSAVVRAVLPKRARSTIRFGSSPHFTGGRHPRTRRTSRRISAHFSMFVNTLACPHCSSGLNVIKMNHIVTREKPGRPRMLHFFSTDRRHRPSATFFNRRSYKESVGIARHYSRFTRL